jgi:hypothetical protein
MAVSAAAIERRYGGILPTWKTLHREGDHAILRGLKKFGGAKQIAPLLYPDANSILPYDLAILIHTAHYGVLIIKGRARARGHSRARSFHRG